MKRTRQRLGLEAYEEDTSSFGVNVACEATVPEFEHGGVGNRKVTKPAGSTLPGSSEFGRDMASSPAGTEAALSFGELLGFPALRVCLSTALPPVY